VTDYEELFDELRAASATAIRQLVQERDEANALAERYARRLAEAAEPGFIGAFARRDAALAERNQFKARAEAAEAEAARLREALTEARGFVADDPDFAASHSRLACLARIDAALTETKDEWEAIRGAAPDATGDLSSEEFVRKLRDDWETKE
jgi:hypothetical protein